MIIQADARNLPLQDNSVQCAITSPPYYGLRDYGTADWEGGDPAHEHEGAEVVLCAKPLDSETNRKQLTNKGANDVRRGNCACGAIRVDSQLGLERSPEEYVDALVEVFNEVHRVLKPDGTLWLNLGDSYYNCSPVRRSAAEALSETFDPTQARSRGGNRRYPQAGQPWGLKMKDQCFIPHRVAMALQMNGWYVRNTIIWEKPNCFPESQQDRLTKTHEYIFLLTKSDRYYFDQDAIREPYSDGSEERMARPWNGETVRGHPSGVSQLTSGGRAGGNAPMANTHPHGRLKRDVWTIKNTSLRWGLCNNCKRVTEKEKKCEHCGGELTGHYATFPMDLVRPCILAGTSAVGECSVCGKSWVRVRADAIEVDGRGAGQGFKRPSRIKFIDAHGEPRGDDTAWVPKIYPTERWDPQCNCDAPVCPSLVFDPFLGTGTVGVVAEELGRRWCGTELSADNILLAKYRALPITLETLFG